MSDLQKIIAEMRACSLRPGESQLDAWADRLAAADKGEPVGDVKNFDSYEIHFAPIDRSGLDVELVRASLYEKLLKQHEELLFAAREFHLWTKERIADEFLVRQQGRDDLKIRLYKTIDRWMAEESNLCKLLMGREKIRILTT